MMRKNAAHMAALALPEDLQRARRRWRTGHMLYRKIVARVGGFHPTVPFHSDSLRLTIIGRMQDR